jgi:hypothetical protein
LIHYIRGQRVLLDADFAAIYRVTTEALNQEVKRNENRFPADFCFQLGNEEMDTLTSQNVISKPIRGDRTKPPSICRAWCSPSRECLEEQANRRHDLFVIRAFIKTREQLATDAAILKRLAAIEKTLLVHDSTVHDLYQNYCRCSRLRPTCHCTESVFVSPRIRESAFRNANS